MPLEPIKFDSAEEVNTFILNLRKAKIFTEEKLDYEFVVATDGNTYRVSDILKLSDMECEKYAHIKFFLRTKEQPVSNTDFITCSLKEFKNSENKKFFVYNRMLIASLLAIDKQRTIKGQRLVYQKVAIPPENLDTPCPITKRPIGVPFITIYGNTFQGPDLLKYLKINFDSNKKLTDPSTHFLGYLPLDKVMVNHALSSLLIVNHKNYIKNRCDYLLKTIAKQNDQQTAKREALESLHNHLSEIQGNIGITQNLKTELSSNQEILNKSLEDFPKKISQLTAANQILKKYSSAEPTDYDQLKADIAPTNQRNKTLKTGVRVGYGVMYAALFVFQIVFLVLLFGSFVSAIPLFIASAIGLLALITAIVARSKYYDRIIVKFDNIIKETDKLLEILDEITKLQKNIELTENYKRLCETTLQNIDQADLIKSLETQIACNFNLENTIPSPSPSPATLSSSVYLLKTQGKHASFEKETTEKDLIKVDKQEEDEEKKSKSGEVILNINEELTETTPLILN